MQGPSPFELCCVWNECNAVSGVVLEKVSSARGMSQSRQSSMKHMQMLSAFTSTPDNEVDRLLEVESPLHWP